MRRPGSAWGGSSTGARWRRALPPSAGTLERIAALIEREFGVRHHPRYLERPLKAHGFSVQRPAARARERDEPAIAAWPRREWVAIKKAGPPCGAHAAVPRRDRPQLP